jgi:mediator of RNA polymerase II transcription subunit 12
MADNPANNNEPLQIYRSAPPDWLPKLHSQADLGQFHPAALQLSHSIHETAAVNGIVGFHGFQPPRPGQEEDILSQSNVKNGIAIPSASVGVAFAGERCVG